MQLAEVLNSSQINMNYDEVDLVLKLTCLKLLPSLRASNFHLIQLIKTIFTILTHVEAIPTYFENFICYDANIKLFATIFINLHALQ